MADKYTMTNDLSVGVEYRDSDDNKKSVFFQIPSPKTNLTEASIRSAVGTALGTGIFMDSNAQVTLSAEDIYTAFTTNETINDLDIGWED